jgi:chemotaxis response regulator CheB
MPTAKKRIKPNKQREKIKAFPIVSIGASVGGLNAIGSFFEAMPDQLSVKE